MSADLPETPRDCRQEFAPIAAKYRRASWFYGLVAIPTVGCLLLSRYEHYPLIGLAGFIVGWVVLTAGLLFRPKLICPNCQHRTDRDLEYCCPQCGSRAIDREPGYFSLGRCNSCHSEMARRKGNRLYKIRYCTVCGAYLDEAGV